MKSYPSIGKKTDSEIEIYAFDKLDGSNIRAEYSQKRGFYKFGSRRCLIDENHPDLGESVALIRQKYEKDLTKIFRSQKWTGATCFFEFYGPNSFAGFHEQEEHTVTLFDVNVYKKGFLPPSDFIKCFGHLDIPAVLYRGSVNPEFVKSVEESNLKGMTFEGVVCKATKKKKIVMFKIKSKAWLNKLKNYCQNNQQLYAKLS